MKLFRKKHTNPTPVEPEGVEIQETASDDLRRFALKARKIRPSGIKRICDALAGKDIRYRGPLSYRGLRVIGWLFFVLMVCGILLHFAAERFPNALPIIESLGSILPALWQFSIVLFMLANFSLILHATKGYKPLLLRFGSLALAEYAAFLILIYHYVEGLLHLPLFTEPFGSANELLETMFDQGFYAFNIFIDLLLCTLLTLFLYHTPKRGFAGRRIVLYRLLTLLPILYELGMFALKLLSAFGYIRIPVFLWPLLPAKPPVFFVVFTLLALFIKYREGRFLASGFTHDEFRRYLKTNRNSLQVSVFTAIMFVIAGCVDLALLLGLPHLMGISDTSASNQAILSYINIADSIDLGGGIVLLITAPFLLLFSYTRTHKDNRFDLILPFAAIAVSILCAVEILFQMLRHIPAV